LDGSIEKLSSGYKINKAADDASGLAVSEKMKAQINALSQASANAADGVNLVQTAEGYLNEVETMLNRAVTLAMKSANGTMESVSGSSKSTANSGVMGAAGTDRDAIQQEMDALFAEIDRIANTANFNNVKLFDGSLATTGYGKLNATTAKSTKTIKNGFSYMNITGVITTLKAGKAGVSTPGLVLQIGETSREADKLTVSLFNLSTAALLNTVSAYANGDKSITATGTKGVSMIQWNSKNTVLGSNGKTITGFTLNVSTQKSASIATEALRTLINTVSTQRAQLGAIQNRLEHTINNLDTTTENIKSAESQIRDTDMAKEMAEYTKNNVLQQAAQTMLAQANQSPQQVLQLLG
jgi:flagellin